METRTYTERSNARRAARAFGVDPDSITETDDGFTFPLPEQTAEADDQPEPTPLKQAVDAAVERGMSPKEFVAEAEKVADALDIPDFCKISPEQRRAAWERNPPKSAAAKPKETISMPKTKSRKPAGKSGSDKTTTLLSMLKGKGSTVEAMTKALDWLPHTLRARISRLPKDDKKIKIERERVDGVTSYRIAS